LPGPAPPLGGQGACQERVDGNPPLPVQDFDFEWLSSMSAEGTATSSHPRRANCSQATMMPSQISRGRASWSYKLALAFMRAFPVGALPPVARFAGRIQYHIDARKRGAYLANIGQSVDFTGHTKPWHAFQSHALNILELLKAAAGPPAPVTPVTIRGREFIDQARAAGCGIILTTLHSGNWELAGTELVRAGYPITTVAGEQLCRGWSEEIKRLKAQQDIQVVSSKRGVRGLHRALRANRAVVLHLDGDAYTGGVDATLLGHRVRVPAGPARLARAVGAPVAFAYCVRTKRGLDVVIEKPAPPPSTRGEETTLTHRLVRRMEKRIVEAPGQWCIFRKL
jgi:lauroyl/myristoyl acyltransferase